LIIKIFRVDSSNIKRRKGVDSYAKEFLKKQDKEKEDEYFLCKKEIEYFQNLGNMNGQYVIDQEDIT